MILDMIVKIMLATFSLTFLVKSIVDFIRYKKAEKAAFRKITANYDAEETEDPYADLVDTDKNE